jgi:hypothetical protein
MQVLLRSAEGAATGAFALREHTSNLRKLVLEDLTQLERLELLQQDQKGKGDRLLLLDPLLGIGGLYNLFSENGFR